MILIGSLWEVETFSEWFCRIRSRTLKKKMKTWFLKMARYKTWMKPIMKRVLLKKLYLVKRLNKVMIMITWIKIVQKQRKEEFLQAVLIIMLVPNSAYQTAVPLSIQPLTKRSRGRSQEISMKSIVSFSEKLFISQRFKKMKKKGHFSSKVW